MKNKTLILGFTAGALYFIWKLIVLSQGKQHVWLSTFPAAPLVGLTGIAIFIAITRYSLKGASFAEDFKVGARTALVAGLTAGLFVFIYYKWIDPEYLVIKIQENLDHERALGRTPEEMKNVEDGLNNFFSEFWYSTFTISGTAFLGMAFALIVSGLKRAFNVL